MNPASFWNSHTRKIIVQCLLVTTAMVASSLTIAWIVYANLVDENCPSEELCPGSDIAGATSANYFYIDFPATRLALISSASSTLSFTLIGYLMTITAYNTAASLLRASRSDLHEELPSPYQLSVLLRVLNAELMVLWTLALSKIKRVFWHGQRAGDSRPPRVLNIGVVVFVAGVIGSLLVQAADVYFHIAAEAVELVQVQNLSSTTHHFSRGLAPWCLNRPTVSQEQGQKNYLGCAITARPAPENNATSLAPTNATTIQDMKNTVSDQHRTINFTDVSGVQYALVGPADGNNNMDWKATSLGVSTICSAIPEGACNVSRPTTGAKNGQGSPVMLVPFNCTVETAGIDIQGNLTSQNTATHMMNFHKYAAESTPFFGNTLFDLVDFDTVLENINNGEDANEILKNDWSVLVLRKIPSAVQGDFSQLPPSFVTDARIWKHPLLGAFVLLHCNVTVWDMTYKSVASNITILNKAPSNGSTSGIASMPGTRFVGSLANIFQDESTGPFSRSSPTNFIRAFELGMSKAYSYPLASQMSVRPSLLAQERTSKVVTRLPVAALWILVTTNLVYAALGLSIAIYALMRVTEDVGQVQMRLSVTGLVAALFDRQRFEKAVSGEEELFEEKTMGNAGMKTIAFAKTKEGGFWFALYRSSGLAQKDAESPVSKY